MTYFIRVEIFQLLLVYEGINYSSWQPLLIGRNGLNKCLLQAL